MKPAEFIRSKFADTMSAKHNFMFFMDALGGISRFDSQQLNNSENYAYKISADFKSLYHRALQKGQAFNLPDVLARAFEKEGLCDSHSELYKKLCKFAEILKEKECVETGNKVEKIAKGMGWKTYALIGLGVVALVGIGAALSKRSKEQCSQ